MTYNFTHNRQLSTSDFVKTALQGHRNAIKDQFQNDNQNWTEADCDNPCNAKMKNSLYKRTNSFTAIDKFTATILLNFRD